jgi:ubiquinone/menaquinone biosynthesis C-methylase UbiE
MGHLAARNLKRALVSPQYIPNKASKHSADYTKIRLTRGIAQHLPFPTGCFDSVVATFPADYIFDSVTLEEAGRVLSAGGRFIVLPGASILGHGFMDRMMAFLFRITGETPPHLSEILHERAGKAFARSNFHVQIHELEIKSSLVYILVATKSSEQA